MMMMMIGLMMAMMLNEFIPVINKASKLTNKSYTV